MKHIAFIMDGNGRWAEAKGQPRLAGHRAGIVSLEGLLAALPNSGVEFATFYAFSTENWQRPADEVNGLMKMAADFFKNKLNDLHKKNIRIEFIGDHSDTSPIPKSVLKILQQAREKTADNTSVTAIFAFNYGGHDEIVRAAKALHGKGIVPTAEALQSELDSGRFPAPDLIIRTSGEQRLSNFLPWQSAYSELYFTDTLWPDFTATELRRIIAEVEGRERRFGKTSAQTKKAKTA